MTPGKAPRRAEGLRKSSSGAALIAPPQWAPSDEPGRANSEVGRRLTSQTGQLYHEPARSTTPSPRGSIQVGDSDCQAERADPKAASARRRRSSSQSGKYDPDLTWG